MKFENEHRPRRSDVMKYGTPGLRLIRKAQEIWLKVDYIQSTFYYQGFTPKGEKEAGNRVSLPGASAHTVVGLLRFDRAWLIWLNDATAPQTHIVHVVL